MNPRTLLALLLLAAALGGAVWWQTSREADGAFDVDRPLFERLDPALLESVRLDHLERGLGLTLRRHESDGWRISDPIDYPAEPARVRHLLEVLTTNRATPVAGSRKLADLGLSPPRAVLELTEALPSGPRIARLELGAVDLDGQHVFVRVEGTVLRTVRNLDTALERELYQWRRAAVLSLAPQHVVELRRSGRSVLDALPDEPDGAAPGPMDLTFEAASDIGGWRATRPYAALVDPLPLAAWLSTVCGLRARRFVDVEGDPALYHPDAPEMTIELVDVRGLREELAFHRSRNGRWLCATSSSSTLFELEETDVLQLAMPAYGFVDMRLLRVLREGIENVHLLSPAGELTLERDGLAWRVRLGDGAARSADPDAVADLLGKLEQARFVRIEPDAAPPADVRRAIRVRAEGVEYGGEFAASAGSTGGALFARTGEDVVFLADEDLVGVCDTPIAALLDRRLVALPELAVVRVELARPAADGGTRAVFVRDARSGRWSPEGLDTEARAFLPVVERVLSVRATEFVGAGSVDMGQADTGRADTGARDPVEVTVVAGGGDPVRYRIAAAPDGDGSFELYLADGVRAKIAPGLHARLLELVRGP